MSEGVPTTKLFGLRLLVCRIRNYTFGINQRYQSYTLHLIKKMDPMILWHDQIMWTYKTTKGQIKQSSPLLSPTQSYLIKRLNKFKTYLLKFVMDINNFTIPPYVVKDNWINGHMPIFLGLMHSINVTKLVTYGCHPIQKTSCWIVFVDLDWLWDIPQT